jgi:hypothetical protein
MGNEPEPDGTPRPEDTTRALATVAQVAAESKESIERLVQKELRRLACLTGKPERNWGKRSRAALRRFALRARPKTDHDTDEGMLRLLRAYPANYCKSCSPGQAACEIDITGALSAHSNNAIATSDPDAPPPAYLPPWMRAGDALNPADEAASEQVAPTGPIKPGPASEAKKRRRRKSMSHRGVRRGHRSAITRPQWRRSWPSLSYWPRGR